MQITESTNTEGMMFYESDGGNRNGMHYILYAEKHNTKEEIRTAKEYIRIQQDALSIKVKPMTNEEWRKATRHYNKNLETLYSIKTKIGK